ncbi:MAG TPA: NADH-quinone oxidoreductase subunit M [Actinomycetes bacterium]|nr:NADH-quinone oxidoreductase subunit M [Actinomycetes bacterium]
MNDFPILTTLGVLPFVAALVVALLPRGRELLAKQITLGVTLVMFALTIAMALAFEPDSSQTFQFVESTPWIKQFGISYAVGVDGTALVLIALATFLAPIVVLAGWNDADETGRHRPQTYFALILALMGTIVYVFAATDLFLFYVAFEVMLIPVYFLIGMFGRGQRTYAAVKFLLYSLLGGLLLLAALIALYVVSADELGAGTFDWNLLAGMPIDEDTQKILFAGFFFAFAVKAPMFPVHTWLPDAAASGTPATNTLLVGVLDKVATFAMLRLVLPIFPDASEWAAPFVVLLAVISIVYGALVAIGQTDMNRLIAYTSVSHFGFIILGIFAFTEIAGSGAVVYMLAHGLSTAALFIGAGYLLQRRGSSLIQAFGGIQRVAPILAGFFLFAGLSGLAMPGMASFVGELTVLIGSYQRWPVAAVIAVVAIVLSALYILIMYQRVAHGPATDGVKTVRDVVPREIVAFAPLIVLTVALGVFPKPVFEVVNPSVERSISYVEVDPVEPDVVVDDAGATTDEGGSD